MSDLRVRHAPAYGEASDATFRFARFVYGSRSDAVAEPAADPLGLRTRPVAAGDCPLPRGGLMHRFIR